MRRGFAGPLSRCLLLAFALANAAASDADIQAVVSEVSESEYTACQKNIEGMGLGSYSGPAYNQKRRGRRWRKPAGDLGNQEARQYLADKLKALALNVGIQGRFLNVVAEVRGAKAPERIYIVCAHYDTASSNVPGGDDNASGTAGVLEAARVLSQHSFECTIRFICYNAEEDDASGSSDYVEKAVKAGKENVAGVVNLDMIVHPRHDNNPDFSMAVGVSTARRHKLSKDWAWKFIAAAKKFVPDLAVDSGSPFLDKDSDDASFADEDYPALSLSEDAADEGALANSHYHSSQDASDRAAGAHYDYAFATRVVKAAVALVAQEAGLVGPVEHKASASNHNGK